MTSALILAAGMGTRLLPLTRDRPKALVEVAGKPLLARLIHACAAAGLSDVVVVTGCLQHVIDDWLATTALPLPTRSVHNPEFDSKGNAWSVYTARHALHGAFIKLDGDLVVDPTVIAGVAARRRSALALDRRGELDDEAMKASVAGDGRVTALGKWIPTAEAHGESIGIERIAAEDAPRIFRALADTVRKQPNAYYEDAYHRLIQAGELLMEAHDIGDARWTEIDSADDLAHAEAMLRCASAVSSP